MHAVRTNMESADQLLSGRQGAYPISTLPSCFFAFRIPLHIRHAGATHPSSLCYVHQRLANETNLSTHASFEAAYSNQNGR
jgi:hypothetical protein